MKGKITFDLPTREKLLAGLTAADLHPALARAEQAVADAERELERARRDLADHERLVAALPARIQRGEVKASELPESMRKRDSCALLLQPKADALAKARELSLDEAKNAKLAVEREVMKRAEQLERLAREVSPVLDELREMSLALSRVLHPQSMGMCAVDWTCGLNCTAGIVMSNANTRSA